MKRKTIQRLYFFLTGEIYMNENILRRNIMEKSEQNKENSPLTFSKYILQLYIEAG